MADEISNKPHSEVNPDFQDLRPEGEAGVDGTMIVIAVMTIIFLAFILPGLAIVAFIIFSAIAAWISGRSNSKNA